MIPDQDMPQGAERSPYGSLIARADPRLDVMPRVPGSQPESPEQRVAELSQRVTEAGYQLAECRRNYALATEHLQHAQALYDKSVLALHKAMDDHGNGGNLRAKTS
jgi:hypothetical protein